MPVFSSFLRYFDEVVRQGSIRRAADRLNVSPSAVNRQILNLEDELGAALFERLPKGLRLTAAGELFVHSTRHWLQDYERVRSEIEDLKGIRRGRVSIAVVEGAASEFVAEVLGRFNKEYPRITFSTFVAGSDALTRMLVSNDVELAVVFNPPPLAAIKIRQQAKFRLGVVVPRSHPLASRKRLRLHDCAAYPVIMPDENLSLRAILEAALARSGAAFQLTFTANSIAMIKAMARQGVGVAFLTEIEVTREVQQGDLVYISLEDRGIPFPTLTVCCAADRHLPMAAELVAHRFADELAQRVSRGGN